MRVAGNKRSLQKWHAFAKALLREGRGNNSPMLQQWGCYCCAPCCCAGSSKDLAVPCVGTVHTTVSREQNEICLGILIMQTAAPGKVQIVVHCYQGLPFCVCEAGEREFLPSTPRKKRLRKPSWPPRTWVEAKPDWQTGLVERVDMLNSCVPSLDATCRHQASRTWKCIMTQSTQKCRGIRASTLMRKLCTGDRRRLKAYMHIFAVQRRVEPRAFVLFYARARTCAVCN